MGALPQALAQQLRDELGLRRAIETGTFRGGGARLLGTMFPEVVSIELSEELATAAQQTLADVQHVRIVQGDSRQWLPRLADRNVPTLYFLDGHWSGGPTAGEQTECPVLGELEAIAGGHPDDCVFIDDARLFTASPPPPHDPEEWPDLVEVIDALRAGRPGHHVTVLHDLIIGVPARARRPVDEFGRAPLDAPQPAPPPSLLGRLRRQAGRGA
ncbi:MAG: hypothetical protein QOJ57_1249 [Thermoleophilaceae bacterium]|jgi:hypothetical protein|nr:hypothetical protein [Thermoleophilaceae bacterium]